MVTTALGDSLEVLKTIEDNFVDSVVCDPPYFLTNSGGSGFMGKEWDSLSVRNAFAESVLRSLSPVWLMGEESSALANVSTKTKSKNQGKSIRALYVTRDSIGRSHKLNQTSFSVLENVLTRPEVLALSRELCPSLTSAVESQPENVLYVASSSFTAKCPKSIAQELALKLDTERLCEDLETLHTLMGDRKTNAPIEEMTGRPFERKSTEEISSLVKSVENIVLAERYNVTTSSLIEFQKTIRWITSLRFVRSAMGTFTENPANIQLLSERFHYKWLKEVYRVMKPGAHLLAFAGTRTYGRLAVAVEDAGFEIRDQIQWIYGSGFPKSHDISKAIDKAAGAKREAKPLVDSNGRVYIQKEQKMGEFNASKVRQDFPEAVTFAAKQWQGFGTALKPANEPIVLARKPLEKGLTVAENVLKWGTGALNIDGSRIGTEQVESGRFGRSECVSESFGEKLVSTEKQFSQGRWPANVLFDEEAAAVLDEQSGELVSRWGKRNQEDTGKSSMFGIGAKGNAEQFIGDSGGASRFFYCAKASKSERNAGLEGMPERLASGLPMRSKNGERGGEGLDGTSTDRLTKNQNHHPTVKPIKLMSYLCKLITPPGGIVLDPFMGSGSTGVAALSEGFGFFGIEMETQYCDIAKARLKYTQEKIEESKNG